MREYVGLFFTIWFKIFFLLTPFFILSVFLVMTQNMSKPRQRKLIVRVISAAMITCLILFFFGSQIFTLFGITVDSFRVGAGVLLFLSAVQLVQKSVDGAALDPDDTTTDIAVVPLAIPIMVGPATIGTLLVMGADIKTWMEFLIACCAMLVAILSIGLVLVAAPYIEQMIGKRGIAILSKLTGLIIAALASQLAMTGIKNFFTNAGAS